MEFKLSSVQRTSILISFTLIFIISTVLYLPDYLNLPIDTILFNGSSMFTRNFYFDEMNKLQPAREWFDMRFIDFPVLMLPPENRSTRKYQISWINIPFWFPLPRTNGFLQQRCVHQNCKITEYKHHFGHSDALILNAADNLHFNISPVFTKRTPNQIWVFFQMEPPPIITYNWVKEQKFRDALNWTWSYRLNADIFNPIRTLQRRNGTSNLNYKKIYKRKTKMAAWVVSHCHTQSLRENYVSKLVKAGIDVDIFGRCSVDRKRVDTNFIMKTISQDYKFYLAFENSLCVDYVTEKFFTYYGLDVILVVRGGFKYAKFFNKSAFIDTSDFSSVKQLAEFMLNVSKNEETYTRYLLNKDRYVPGLTPLEAVEYASCQLCSKLNNIDRYFNIYDDISKSVAKDKCYAPNDIN